MNVRSGQSHETQDAAGVRGAHDYNEPRVDGVRLRVPEGLEGGETRDVCSVRPNVELRGAARLYRAASLGA